MVVSSLRLGRQALVPTRVDVKTARRTRWGIEPTSSAFRAHQSSERRRRIGASWKIGRDAELSPLRVLGCTSIRNELRQKYRVASEQKSQRRIFHFGELQNHVRALLGIAALGADRRSMTKSSSCSGLRAVAMSLLPAAKTASAIFRPKPRELPVTNHVLDIVTHGQSEYVLSTSGK